MLRSSKGFSLIDSLRKLSRRGSSFMMDLRSRVGVEAISSRRRATVAGREESSRKAKSRFCGMCKGWGGENGGEAVKGQVMKWKHTIQG